MEKVYQVLKSRKFWALVASLVSVWGAYFMNGLSVVEAVQATVAALAAYSIGTGIEAAGK